MSSSIEQARVTFLDIQKLDLISVPANKGDATPIFSAVEGHLKNKKTDDQIFFKSSVSKQLTLISSPYSNL